MVAKTNFVPKNKKGTACLFLKDNLCTIYKDRPNFCDIDYMIKFISNDNRLTYKDCIERQKKDCIKFRKEVSLWRLDK